MIMPREWVIAIDELDEATFAPYGRIVRAPAGATPSTGPGWECWYGFQVLEPGWPVHFGLVATRLRPIVVDEMERHVHTYEFLYPHGEDLIQPVALPLEMENATAQPDPATVRAFRIPVGTGIILHAGTWHSAAAPVSVDTTYGFACMEPDFPYTAEWVSFLGGDSVRVSLP